MLIIVEGIDRVGKTTLCNKLSAELNIPIYKHPEKVIDYRFMDNVNETDKMLQLLDLCKITHANVIFDRFHLSDFTYGTIERKYDEDIALIYFQMLDLILRDMNAILIMVNPTNITESSRQHGKDLTRYFKKMQTLYTMSSMKKYSCYYNSIDDVVDVIKGGV